MLRHTTIITCLGAPNNTLIHKEPDRAREIATA